MSNEVLSSHKNSEKDTTLNQKVRSWKEHLAIAVMKSSYFTRDLDWKVDEKGNIFYSKKVNTEQQESYKNEA
ncbi:hypothetical protein XF24_00850 [candidate division SR1 bacterium Aalborg_AAW-1]|nr:hypothetical protein XF24_00850 [candidate division SR1 bacterium Aalborg_AAW-1]